MPTYAAVLGHLPKLSVAEIAATVPDFRMQKTVANAIGLFHTSATLTQKDLEKLGGTVFLVEELAEQPSSLDQIPATLASQLMGVKGKATFSLRGFGMDRTELHRLYRDCKIALKKKGIASRYVGNERRPAASVLLHKEDMLTGKGGCELTLVKDEDSLWVGRTVGAQDVDAYSLRDMEKPVRDTRSGLLPPKLAQIMLNFGMWLSKDKRKDAKTPVVVFDPFCGTGVIPMESVLRHWQVFASDLSPKAVAGCEKNLEWLRKQYDIKKRDVPSIVWKQDARKMFAFPTSTSAPKAPPQMIVTETALGPALTDRPTAKDAGKLRSENDALQIEFLRNAAEHLPGVPIVATWPVWYLRSDQQPLERVWKEVEKLGYRPVLPAGLPSDDPAHPCLIYRRSDQFVGRQIVLLAPPKHA